jgi:hypothetical protein
VLSLVQERDTWNFSNQNLFEFLNNSGKRRTGSARAGYFELQVGNGIMQGQHLLMAANLSLIKLVKIII